jgi:hypothetical protein
VGRTLVLPVAGGVVIGLVVAALALTLFSGQHVDAGQTGGRSGTRRASFRLGERMLAPLRAEVGGDLLNDRRQPQAWLSRVPTMETTDSQGRRSCR